MVTSRLEPPACLPSSNSSRSPSLLLCSQHLLQEPRPVILARHSRQRCAVCLLIQPATLAALYVHSQPCHGPLDHTRPATEAILFNSRRRVICPRLTCSISSYLICLGASKPARRRDLDAIVAILASNGASAAMSTHSRCG